MYYITRIFSFPAYKMSAHKHKNSQNLICYCPARSLAEVSVIASHSELLLAPLLVTSLDAILVQFLHVAVRQEIGDDTIAQGAGPITNGEPHPLLNDHLPPQIHDDASIFTRHDQVFVRDFQKGWRIPGGAEHLRLKERGEGLCAATLPPCSAGRSGPQSDCAWTQCLVCTALHLGAVHHA